MSKNQNYLKGAAILGIAGIIVKILEPYIDFLYLI